MPEWRPFSDYRNVFVEITKSEHGHGGKGWEYGICLFSPTRNRSGADRYSLMREPVRGDLVLHFLTTRWPDGISESRLAGRSVVVRKAEEIETEPPLAGSWANLAPYYRIALKDYTPFPTPLPLRTLIDQYGEEIREDIVNTAPSFYPFNRWSSGIRTVQGIYLARLTPGLYGIFRRALGVQEANANESGSPAPVHAEYVETRRMARERYYFARNPGLAQAAKALHGCVCEVCGFDFGAAYGPVGEGYIECHHKNPLSERPEEEQLEGLSTSVDEVAVVCSNCHRMLHRKRPAMAVEELRDLLAKPL